MPPCGPTGSRPNGVPEFRAANWAGRGAPNQFLRVGYAVKGRGPTRTSPPERLAKSDARAEDNGRSGCAVWARAAIVRASHFPDGCGYGGRPPGISCIPSPTRTPYHYPTPHTMAKTTTSIWEELSTPAQLDQLERLARRRRWGLSLLLIGWLHLLAFSICYYLTAVTGYNEAAGYLAVWAGELCGVALIFRLCGGPRPAEESPPLARFVVRIWVAYFMLAFNLCSMNALRGHRMFELFPAMASLASFAFLAMAFAVSRRFYGAVLVMFAAGLLMAANLPHAYLVFGLAWWLVLSGVGLSLLWGRRASRGQSSSALGSLVRPDDEQGRVRPADGLNLGRVASRRRSASCPPRPAPAQTGAIPIPRSEPARSRTARTSPAIE